MSDEITTIDIARRIALLKPFFSYQEDRFTGAVRLSTYLHCDSLNNSLAPTVELVLATDQGDSWSAFLILRWSSKGKVALPGVNTPVYWLIDEQRFESRVLDSNNQTKSKTYRIGTDIMPGPLTVWASAPVTTSKSSGWLMINLSEQVQTAFTKASSADFRMAGFEFRLSGQRVNQGLTPLSFFASGLIGLASEGWGSAGLDALVALSDPYQKKKSNFYWVIGVIILIGLILLFSFTKNDPTPNAVTVTATPSPSPTESPSLVKKKK